MNSVLISLYLFKWYCHVFLDIDVQISWKRLSVYSFVENQSCTNKTMNEEHKAIRYKCILNNKKTVVWGGHRLIVLESGLQGGCGVWLGHFSVFRRNVLPSSSVLRMDSRSQHPWRFGRYVPSELPGAVTQSESATAQQTCFLRKKTASQLMKFFSAVSFVVGNASSFPHDLSRVFSSSLTFACCTSEQVCGSAMGRMPWRRWSEYKWTLRNSIAPSLSVASLISLLHTNIHCLRRARYGRK